MLRGYAADEYIRTARTQVSMGWDMGRVGGMGGV